MTGPGPRLLGELYRFHGVQQVLPVADVVRAARYFCRVLDLELDFVAGEPSSYARVKMDVRPAGERGWDDPVCLRLWQAGARDAQPWHGEIAIHVGHDIDGLHAAHAKRGVDIVEPPTSRPWGLRESAIREPDGHIPRFGGHL
ncbi:MAG: VOC family protein [Janthinobacterium lividum]